MIGVDGVLLPLDRHTRGGIAIVWILMAFLPRPAWKQPIRHCTGCISDSTKFTQVATQ